MRWSASAPATWPADHRWQRVWTDAVVRATSAARLRPDGVVQVDGAGPADPEVRLAAGTHLQPGAEYRIAPELTSGVLRAWVGEARAAGVEWAPRTEPGRAHVEVQGLDRLTGLRVVSTLQHLQGRVRLALDDPGQVLEVEGEVPWLRVHLRAGVSGGLLDVDLEVRGLGMWWPTLAPLLLGSRAAVQRELETATQDLARMLHDLATTGEITLARVETPQQRQLRHLHELRTGTAELGRRQRTVADTLAALPWWRRTAGRWRTELAALPPVELPDGALVWPPSWTAVEQELTARVLRRVPWRRRARLDAVVEQLTDELVRTRTEHDAYVASSVAAARTEPWLTDASFDLAWLATPTRLLRELGASVSSP
jgi:hypothetical protein